MKQITPTEFERAVMLDPAWAAKLTEPVEITGFCELARSPITHLSPLLHFGRGKQGFSANFLDCPNLKVAAGNFSGYVNFSGSGIEEIGELVVTESDDVGDAAYFHDCDKLKVAGGTFHGFVNFSKSGIKSIDKLIITSPNCQNLKADFSQCDVRLPAEFLGEEYAMDQTTRQKNLARIAARNAQKNQAPLEI